MYRGSTDTLLGVTGDNARVARFVCPDCSCILHERINEEFNTEVFYKRMTLKVTAEGTRKFHINGSPTLGNILYLTTFPIKEL